MIDLHFSRTVNGWKIPILLEETGTPYRVVHYDMLAGEHLTSAFGALNLNHRLPVIVDQDPTDGGEPIIIAESAAILVYLADKTESFLPREARPRASVLQWLAWQVSAVGPMMGQASFFIRYAQEKHDFSIARFRNESLRLMAVLNRRLQSNQYVAGDYSIADMALFPWIRTCEKVGLGISFDDHPNVKRWVDLIATRPMVRRVFESPETGEDPGLLQKRRDLTPEEWSNMSGDRMLAAARGEYEIK